MSQLYQGYPIVPLRAESKNGQFVRFLVYSNRLRSVTAGNRAASALFEETFLTFLNLRQ